MRKFAILLALIALIISMAATVQAAPPPDGPPGLERAIAAQEAHTDRLLGIPGVVGTAVGLSADGRAAVLVFTERTGVHGIPRSLDGIPVVVRLTGKITALRPPSGKGPFPTVTITEPNDKAKFASGVIIDFSGTANDNEDGDVTDSLSWKSSIDGPIGHGGSFSTTLSDGTHKITASATDSDGKTGSASINITVGSGGNGGGDLATTDHWPRPVPIGVSTGNQYECSAGTIGARVKKGSNVYALSNNHVYALENKAPEGSHILQPGRYDTQCVLDIGYNSIGTLSDFVKIDFTGEDNVVDAAIAQTTDSELDYATPSDGYGVPSSVTHVAKIGEAVQKYGRTTQLTKGTVVGINATINVGYDSGTARFVQQIVIKGTKGKFSNAGDSGSLIVTDPDRNPTGLLFAGGGPYTFANPINDVLSTLSISIDGE